MSETLNTENMTRDEFLEQMGALWDAKGRIDFNIKTFTYKKRKESVVSSFTKNLAAELEAMLDQGEYPFDIPVVAIKDIVALRQYRGLTSVQMGKALTFMKAENAGQSIDDAGARTRVWIMSDKEDVPLAHSSEKDAIYQRKTDE